MFERFKLFVNVRHASYAPLKLEIVVAYIGKALAPQLRDDRLNSGYAFRYILFSEQSGLPWIDGAWRP